MANGKKRKIRAGGSLIIADAKISFFNGTIYFLVYSRSCINQLLGCLCIQISQDGEGRVQPRQGAGRVTTLTLPLLIQHQLSLKSLLHFICIFCLMTSISKVKR